MSLVVCQCMSLNLNTIYNTIFWLNLELRFEKLDKGRNAFPLFDDDLVHRAVVTHGSTYSAVLDAYSQSACFPLIFVDSQCDSS